MWRGDVQFLIKVRRAVHSTHIEQGSASCTDYNGESIQSEGSEGAGASRPPLCISARSPLLLLYMFGNTYASQAPCDPPRRSGSQALCQSFQVKKNRMSEDADRLSGREARRHQYNTSNGVENTGSLNLSKALSLNLSKAELLIGIGTFMPKLLKAQLALATTTTHHNEGIYTRSSLILLTSRPPVSR